MDREKINTLDKACSEIERLESELASAKQSKPSYDTVPKPSTPPPPSLQEVSTQVLMEAIDLSRRNGDMELMKKLYAELNRRRGR